MNRTQAFMIGATALFFGGTATALHFDQARRDKAMFVAHVLHEADAMELVDRPAAPMALTASDGTGLTLAALAAKIVSEDPVASTELRLVFENPLDRVIEGTFRITLPASAAVARFATRNGEQWQEGEIVEKAAAQAAYEDQLSVDGVVAPIGFTNVERPLLERALAKARIASLVDAERAAGATEASRTCSVASASATRTRSARPRI